MEDDDDVDNHDDDDDSDKLYILTYTQFMILFKQMFICFSL